MDEIAPDLWRPTRRHPDWHPGEFGDRVASFALGDAAGDGARARGKAFSAPPWARS